MDLDLCFGLRLGLCAAAGLGSVAGHGDSGTVRVEGADGGMRREGAASEVQKRAGYLSEWVRGDRGRAVVGPRLASCAR